MKVSMAVKRMNALEHERRKLGIVRSAMKFARELVGIKVPKRAAILSMMSQEHIKVREARNIYRYARNAADPHKRRHEAVRKVTA
jgi:hypothetical protein